MAGSAEEREDSRDPGVEDWGVLIRWSRHMALGGQRGGLGWGQGRKGAGSDKPQGNIDEFSGKK